MKCEFCDKKVTRHIPNNEYYLCEDHYQKDKKYYKSLGKVEWIGD